MSPSMLNTPSVMTRIVRSASVARMSRSTPRSASVSPCGKILRSAFVRRMPSMMLAWFSSSETIVAPSGARMGITPVLQVKPDWKVRTASTCLNVARRASSSSWRLIVPAIVRTAPEPAPNRSTASSAAAFSFGWVFRPR